MSIHDFLNKQKYGPRRLPFSNNGAGPVQIPGLGAFAFVSVGSTAYTTGVDVFFHPEGHEDCAKGSLRFHAAITKDLRVKWILDKFTLDYGDHLGARFGSRVLESAIENLDNLYLRAPVSWGFHIGDAAKMEESRLNREWNDLKLTVVAIKGMIGHPPANRTLDDIRAQLGRRESQIAAFEQRTSKRLADLKKIIDAWRAWSGAAGPAPRIAINTAFKDILDLSPAAPVHLLSA